MAESLSDASLLERFASDREEAAFVALIERHGPRVERICRRFLRNEHDVEDVFQATFLVLARKAAGIDWHDSISPWIESVARRLALRARSGAARRCVREVNVSTLVGAPPDEAGRLHERYHPRVVESFVDVESRDLRRVLDDELLRLPEKYRAPVVLCDLEGHTREEAARRLGWPAGSMSRRLDRGRSLLRCRLSRRGVALGVVGLATIAIAAAAMSSLKTSRSDPAWAIRQAMRPFQAESEGGRGYGAILAAAREEGRPPEFDRILSAARKAAAAADRLKRLDPGRSASLWNQLADDMRRSALEVEAACRETNASNLVAAAGRLERSCLACHAVFHQRPDFPGIPGPIPTRFGLPGPARAEHDSPTGQVSSVHVPNEVHTPLLRRAPVLLEPVLGMVRGRVVPDRGGPGCLSELNPRPLCRLSQLVRIGQSRGLLPPLVGDGVVPSRLHPPRQFAQLRFRRGLFAGSEKSPHVQSTGLVRFGRGAKAPDVSSLV